MDEAFFEQAAMLELSLREMAIARAKQAEAKAHVEPEDFDGSCPLCDTEIPPERIAMRYFTCVDCVQEKELRSRLRI